LDLVPRVGVEKIVQGNRNRTPAKKAPNNLGTSMKAICKKEKNKSGKIMPDPRKEMNTCELEKSARETSKMKRSRDNQKNPKP